MADLATIGAAIKTELNTASDASSFNRKFEARLLWAKRQIKLEVANELRVDIAPINSTRQLFSRGRHLLICRYDVGVRKRFEETEEDPNGGKITDEEVSDLAILLDSLWNFFMPKQDSQNPKSGRPLADFQEATAIGPTQELGVDTIILWEDLEGLRQFTGYFPLTIHAVV